MKLRFRFLSSYFISFFVPEVSNALQSKIKYHDKIHEMVITSSKYEVVNTMISSFESHMALTVRKLSSADLGAYRCVAKNSLGEVESVIRIYGILQPSVIDPTTRREDFEYSTPMEGPDNQFGSAEKSDDEDDKESVIDTMKIQNYVTSEHDVEKNRTSEINTSNSLIKQNISNKVKKIINTLESEARDIISNSSCYPKPIILIIVAIKTVIYLS